MRSIKKRICLIANSDIFFESFLVHQSIVLSNYYDIHIVINSDKLDKLSNQYPNLSFHHFSIRRKKFFLIYDLILFIKLFYFFCKYNFDIVHSFTSKV